MAGCFASSADWVLLRGQWEFQVGPVVGISAGDQLWVARYILEVELPACFRLLLLLSR